MDELDSWAYRPFNPRQPIWPEAHVAELNELQRSMSHGQRFTCPRRDKTKHTAVWGQTGVLIATPHGWVCLDCDFTDDWTTS